jgi:phosphoglycerate dehydrogenase-like enzyme
MKIVVNTFPFSIEGLLKLKEDFKDIDFIFAKTKDELSEEIKDADAVIAFSLSEDIISKSKNLKWMQALSAGVDAYPLNLIESMNIILTTGRGIHKIHMTEYAISMMVIAARRLDQFILNQKKYLWDKNVLQGEIYGKTLGIIGLGSIGQEIAKKASLMGMEVYGIKNKSEQVEAVKKVLPMKEIDFIAKNCDYIINLLPHTKETDKIINKEIFNLMKETAVMINMGRGGTVNEDHLYTALTEKKFRLYISDVFEKEPLPETSPLWALDNIIITPHICGPNENYIDKAYLIVKRNIEKYINNEKLDNIYSFENGY